MKYPHDQFRKFTTLGNIESLWSQIYHVEHVAVAHLLMLYFTCLVCVLGAIRLSLKKMYGLFMFQSKPASFVGDLLATLVEQEISLLESPTTKGK